MSKLFGRLFSHRSVALQERQNIIFDNLTKDGVLRGTTLLVYKHMIKNNKAFGPRELQRSLALSSPGLASFHLDKLVRVGLVTKNETEGSFVINSAYLKHYVLLRRHLIPRYFFYAVLSTSLLVWWIGSLYLGMESITGALAPELFYTYMYGTVSVAIFSSIFWYETFNVLKHEAI